MLDYGTKEMENKVAIEPNEEKNRKFFSVARLNLAAARNSWVWRGGASQNLAAARMLL